MLIPPFDKHNIELFLLFQDKGTILTPGASFIKNTMMKSYRNQQLIRWNMNLYYVDK